MKRCFLIFALIAIVATGAFSQEISFSAGGGIYTDMSFGNGYKYLAERIGIRNISFGPYVFFDATYVEAALSLGFGSLTATGSGAYTSGSSKMGNIQQFGFTILGKYPVDADIVTIFPLFGISYNMVLAGKNVNGNKFEDVSKLNQFGLLGGLGADYDINSNLYIRGQVMLQMRFANKNIKDVVKNSPNVDTTLGFGPVIRVGVGYRF
jgi:outer membrane protein W